MKEVLKLRKRRTGQWVTVAGMVLIGACMAIGNTVVFADDAQTYPIEASDSNKFNLTDSPSPLSSENLGTNNRGHEVATLPTTGQVDSSDKTTPEYLMSESSTVSLVTSDVATTETSILASLSEVVPTKSTDSSETLVPSTLSEAPKHAPTSEGAVAEVKIQSETLVEHSINSNNEEESGDNLIYDIHNQEVTITDIKRKETIKKLIIPQKISNYRVTEIGSDAFSGSSLSEVVLPSTLRKIGNYAFSGTQLTKLTLPEGVTEIGAGAFSGSSLKEVVLPRTLTKIGNNAFSGTQLKDITLPTSVTSIGSGAFGSIDSLSSVVIPKNLSNASGAFEGSEHLKTIHFEEGITKIADGLFQGSGISSINIPETVTEIGSRAFSDTGITELYIPDSVTKLGDNSFGTDYNNDFNSLTKVSLPSELQSTSSPFYGQKNLKEVVLRGNWKTIPSSLFSGTGIEKLVIPEGVTEIGAGAFSGSSLKEVVLPRTLTKIGNNAFSGTQLKDITLPTSVTSIGSGAFGSIDSLSSVVIPKNLSNASGAFEGSEHLKTIHFEEGITKIADGLFQGSGISSINIPETVTEIGSRAFSDTGITELYIPDSVTKLGDNSFGTDYNNDFNSLTKVSLPSELQSTSSPFYGQKNLKEVVLRGNWKTIPSSLFSGTGIEKLVIPEGVTEIGAGAFSGSSLKEVVLPRTLTKIGNNAFSGTQLKDITLPTSVTSIGSGAFGSIDSLSSVVIPKNLSNASGAFEGSEHLKTIHFEEGITKIADGLFQGSGISSINIPETVTEIGSRAFSDTGITELYIPDSVTKLGDNSFGTDYNNDFNSLTKVSLPSELQSTSSPFYGQKNLKEVVLRGNWKTIPSSLFSGTGIEKLVIPEGVTEIGAGAFSVSSLKEVVLPRTLTKIGNYAFSGTQLTNMSVPSSVREIGSYAFNSTPLEVINLPYGLQIIGSGAFRNTKLETIEIPEGVTYLDDYTLANIPTLKSVYLPKSLTTFVQSWDTPSESVEYHVYLDSFALEYMIEKQLNFKLRDENVANDDSKVLDSSNSYYLATTTGTRRQGYLGLDLKYAIKKDKSSDDGKYVLHLNIPSTTKVFESKIRVNGQDVTATVSNGYLDIPVSEEVGKIKLMLMTENRKLTNARLFAQLSYQKDRKKLSENIGAINVNIPVLTLTASQVTSRSYSRISGVADPNDQVIAYLDDMVVGQVKIKKDGSYTLDVPLVTPVENKEYTIKVKALSSDGREISETTTVRYEKKHPELVNFIMRHYGYTYNLKENQDKVPVIRFIPGGQFDFEVEYTNTSGNDSLYLVSNREGINKVIELKWDVKKEKYVYTGYFDQENTHYVPGKMTLYLEKGVAPSETIYSSEVQDNLSQRTAGKILILDSDGDGYPDIVDKHRNSWDLGDRDLAIFSLLSYKPEEEIKKIFLAKSFKDKGLKIGGLDQALFENWRLLGSPVFLPGVANINVYRFVNDKTKEIVLAIRGTDEEVRNGGNIGIEKPYLSPEWIDNYFKIWRGISKDKEVIKKSLNLLLPSGSNYDVSIVGHSRGSYLAYILAAEMLTNKLISMDYEKIDTAINPRDLIRGNLKNVVTFNGVGLATWKSQLIDSLINNSLTPLQKILKQLSNDFYKSEREIFELLRTSGLTRAYSIIGDPVSDPFRKGIGIGDHPNLLLPRGEKKHLIHPENGELSEHDIHNFLYYISQGVRSSKNQFRGIGDLKSIDINERISSTALTDFKFAIDPSGVVINDVSKNPITGATTTIYYRGENGEEILWDAGEYSQFNPLVTTVYGEYAWDVPEGFWKVKVSKEGYESKESDWLPVPPPQTEVHFNLKPLSYKIAYKVGDGILKGDVPRSYQTDVDTELPYPVRKGYVFTGWYLDDNFSGEPFFNTLFDKAGDKVLYAKWEKDTKILSDDDNVVTVTVSGNDVNVIGKVVKKEVTNADILEKVGDHNNLLMEIQALDDDGNIVSLSEDAKLDLAVISGRKPYKVLHYVKDKSTFEEVPFNWNEKDKNISLTTSTLGVYLIQSKLTEQQMTTKVRQESRVLKTDKIEYVDDASLDVGKVREIAAVDGQVLVEITDNYVNGELQSSTEKELSRIEPQAKKVYRGTKQVSQVPDVAPIEHNKPEAIIETKVRQESRTLKTDKIEYVDDASLDAGKIREIATVDGQVLVEITDIYVNGELQLSTEKELSRIEPQAKKVYRGTKQVSQVPDVAPIEQNKPEAILETKVRQESRILKTDKVEYVNDASLDAGKIREVAAVDGQVLVETTDIYVNGELQSSTEKELSRIEPQAKKVYRGTKQVSQVPDVAPIEVNRIERNNITKELQGISTVINTKLEPVVMNQSSSEPLSSKETTIRTKGYLPNTSSEYGYGFEWAGIIALATAHFGIISNNRKKNIKN